MVGNVLKLKAMATDIRSEDLTNHSESRSFIKTALKWKGSVTPKILPRVITAVMYSALITFLLDFFPGYQLSVAPFEYSGVVLGLLLVARVNAGMDRWWEARKIWGSIVNQSRNLGTLSFQYTDKDVDHGKKILNWIALLPYTLKDHLRSERNYESYKDLIGEAEAVKLVKKEHMPVYVSFRLSEMLRNSRSKGMDDFAYHRADKERSLLVDAIGACERIQTTPIPIALAIKTRRFIFSFLLLLPFGVVPEAGLLTPLVMLLTSYPLLSLDEIGVGLQSPFDQNNLSHLPLNTICGKIEKNILEIPSYREYDEDISSILKTSLKKVSQ